MTETCFGHMRCPAMIKAGIEDANSQDGIDFCVNHCPYPYCIMFEVPLGTSKTTNKITKRLVNKALAWRLYSIGLPIQTIADIVGKSKATVGVYLGEVKSGRDRRLGL